MLSDTEFAAWCIRLNLSDAATTLITQIRVSEPARRVGGGSANVCGRYPSLKMGKTIQFESHKVELPAIEAYEADADVLEYYDQPTQLRLSFISSQGRKISVQHVPDFLVLRQTIVGFEEWKTEKRLIELAQQQPNHYHQDTDGQWHNDPAEATTATYGIAYCLRLDREINWIEHRNRQFLRSYRDGSYSVAEAIQTVLSHQVAMTPGITIFQILQSILIASADDVYALIATGQFYTDQSTQLLTEPAKVQLFRDLETAKACQIAFPRQSESSSDCEPFHSSLINTDWQPFLQASPEDLSIANNRYRILESYLQGIPLEQMQVSIRTIQRWKHQFQAAQQLHHCGYIGLLPHQSAKGNHTARVTPEAWAFIDQIIDTHYETLQQKGKLTVYGILVQEWQKANRSDICPSHVTFYRHLNHQNRYRQTQKRQGPKAAYQQSAFYWELNLTTPRHGDRPLELTHVDHTELDIEMVCSRTGERLGRPWATVLLDAFSRRVLAVYLSFDRPSYRACMMVLRICVQRFERFPETIVVDNGTEFDSIYFETLLATFNCTKKQRPVARPRFGSIMERFFGTSHSELIHNLQGNTQITKQIRQMTRSISPKTQAVWNLGELYTCFCEYAYEIYDQRTHPALGQSPRSTFVTGITQSGNRPQQKVVNDFTFHILTLPSTPKGSATVHARRGIHINYLDYWAIDDCFLNPDIEGKKVPVRYDPFDVSTAYVYVKGHWVRCISEYHALFQGRSQQEVKITSAELRQQQQQHIRRLPIRAKNLAAYLESTAISETMQLQRLKDLALTDVHQQLPSARQPQSVATPTLLADQQITPAAENGDPIAMRRDHTVLKIDPTQVKPYDNEELWT
jgi:putative transposase